MARTRRRSNSGQFVSGGNSTRTIVVRPAAAPAPVKRRRGRRGGGGGGRSDGIAKDAIAGLGFGLLERIAVSQDLPTIPLLGRKGTVAVAAYLLRKQHPIIADVARAGFVISAYQLVAEGKISGEDDDGATGTF